MEIGKTLFTHVGINSYQLDFNIRDWMVICLESIKALMFYYRLNCRYANDNACTIKLDAMQICQNLF